MFLSAAVAIAAQLSSVCSEPTMQAAIDLMHDFLPLINQAGSLYGGILTEVVSTD